MKRDNGAKTKIKKAQGHGERQRRKKHPIRLMQTNTFEKESFQNKDKSGGERKKELLGKTDGDIPINVPITLVILA